MTAASSVTSGSPTSSTAVTPRQRDWRPRLVSLGGLVILTGICVAAWTQYRASAWRAIPKQIAVAERLLNANQFATARIKSENLLWWKPQQPDALSINGRCLLGEGTAGQAIPVLCRVPEDSGAYEKAGPALATAYLQLGELEQAESTLRRYVRRFPAADTVRDELRWLYFNQFRTREVIALLEEKLQRWPGDLRALPTLADLLDSEYRQQVPFEGVGYLEQIEQKQPGQGLVSLALGYAYWQMGQGDQARTSLQRALATHPDHPQVRLVVAAFLVEQGQSADAEQILTRSPSLDTEDRYWSLRSQLAKHANDTVTALEFLNKAVQIHGNDQRYASRRVTLLRELRRDQEVSEAARIAHELLNADRELAGLVEVRAHYGPTRRTAARIGQLCDQLGRHLQGKSWQLLATQLPRGDEPP